MPTSIEDLFVHNRAWAAQMERERPGFFTGLLGLQKSALGSDGFCGLLGFLAGHPLCLQLFGFLCGELDSGSGSDSRPDLGGLGSAEQVLPGEAASDCVHSLVGVEVVGGQFAFGDAVQRFQFGSQSWVFGADGDVCGLGAVC